MMSNWCLCIQALCVASIIFVDLPQNVECSIFEDIDSLSSLLSTDEPVPIELRNEKLRQIALSYSSTLRPPALNNSQQAAPQPSIPPKSRPPSYYPMLPPLPTIPPDVEVFNPATHPGAKPGGDRYPSIPVYPPRPRPPVFRPPHAGSLPPLRPSLMRPNDIEIFDPSMNEPISLDYLNGLSFGDSEATLFESRDGPRKEEVNSKGESNVGEDRVNVSGQSTTNVEQFEESQNTLKDSNNFVNSTMRDDDPMTPVINKIKSIMFDKFNATFPRTDHVRENETVNVTKIKTPVSAISTPENYGNRVEPPTMPQSKPSTTSPSCNHLFDLIDQLMRIENSKKPDPIPHQDNSASQGTITSYAMYYPQPQAEWESDSQASLPIADYVYREYVEVPIVYAFDRN